MNTPKQPIEDTENTTEKTKEQRQKELTDNFLAALNSVPKDEQF